MQRCNLGDGLTSFQLPGRTFSAIWEERVQCFDVGRSQVAVEDPVVVLQLRRGWVLMDPYVAHTLHDQDLTSLGRRYTREALSRQALAPQR